MAFTVGDDFEGECNSAAGFLPPHMRLSPFTGAWVLPVVKEQVSQIFLSEVVVCF